MKGNCKRALLISEGCIKERISFGFFFLSLRRVRWERSDESLYNI